MKKQKLKSNNAITLIALIITIIVLLILAMVSIKLVWNGGIITHAQNAVDKYGKAQQNEIEQINNIFGNNENQNNAPEELIKYVLGDNLKGQVLSKIVNESDFTMKPLNGENVEMLNFGQYYHTKNSEEIFDNAIYIKYKNKAYRILCEGIDASDFLICPTKSVNLIYEPKGREGQTIEYSIDGTEANKKEWTILYDNGDNLEIISPESIGSLTLGFQDEQATGENDFEKAIDSYNHAIERINAYASSLVTNTNKIAVRSVGSNPENPDSRNTDKYTSERLEDWNGSYNGTEVSINGVGECSDNNCEQDLVRISYWQAKGTGKEYWLASRRVDTPSKAYSSDYVYFCVNVADPSEVNYIGGKSLFGMNSSGSVGIFGNNDGGAVRPIVKINS